MFEPPKIRPAASTVLDMLHGSRVESAHIQDVIRKGTELEMPGHLWLVLVLLVLGCEVIHEAGNTAAKSSDSRTFAASG